MINRDISWYCLILSDIIWYYLIFCDISWFIMIYHDNSMLKSMSHYFCPIKHVVLLGMTWRKLSMWVSRCLVRLHLPMDPNRYDATSPPWPIRVWLYKAPIAFLIISALMFMVGLNLFAYLSSQVCKSSVHRIAIWTTSRLLSCHYQQMRSRAHIVYVCLSWLYGSSISSSEILRW